MNKPTQCEQCERLVRRFRNACSWQSSSLPAIKPALWPENWKRQDTSAWLLDFGAVPLGMRVSQQKMSLSGSFVPWHPSHSLHNRLQLVLRTWTSMKPQMAVLKCHLANGSLAHFSSVKGCLQGKRSWLAVFFHWLPSLPSFFQPAF